LTIEDCYTDRKNFYIFSTLCKGGELFNKIREIRKFNEVEAAGVMKTIISAIAYCHARDIVHQDLKNRGEQGIRRLRRDGLLLSTRMRSEAMGLGAEEI